MRRTYLFCDKCGVGHSHKMPRPGQTLVRIANCFNWDKNQYKKLARVLCTPCKLKKDK